MFAKAGTACTSVSIQTLLVHAGSIPQLTRQMRAQMFPPQLSNDREKKDKDAFFPRWWYQIFLIFTPTWGRFPF